MVSVPSFFKYSGKIWVILLFGQSIMALKKGELSITQREGIITCIPKGNKPRHFITNYRPISLLNCIYKIASGAIANRIKGTLQKLIHKDQTGFIAGRYIYGENTRLIYDIMDYTEENNLPVYYYL